MSTLRDLRETLVDRADGLDDTERYARPVAVRERIRVVRRRRTAAASVAAVLVLVAGTALVSALPGRGSLEPAGVVGVDVPRTIELLEFPYELAGTETLDDGDEVEVDARQAVTLVGSELGGGSATLVRDGDPVARVVAGSPVAAPLPVEGGERLRVVLDGTPGDARVGVAVYEETDDLAPGVSNGTSVFRETYAGNPLLGAAFADAGASSLTFDATGADLTRFVAYCVTPDGLEVTVDIEVDGEPALGIGCGDSPRRDATQGTSGIVPDLGPGPHEVHATLTRDGEPADGTDTVLGVGVYAEERGGRLWGQDFSARVEQAGRTWVLDSVETSPVTIEAPEDLLLAAFGRGRSVALSWTGELGGAGSLGSITSPRSAGMVTGGLLPAHDDYRIELEADEGRVLVYVPD